MRTKFVSSVVEELIEFQTEKGPKMIWSEFFDVIGYFSRVPLGSIKPSRQVFLTAVDILDVAFSRSERFRDYVMLVINGWYSTANLQSHHAFWNNKNIARGRSDIPFMEVVGICAAIALRSACVDKGLVVFYSARQVNREIGRAVGTMIPLQDAELKKLVKFLPSETKLVPGSDPDKSRMLHFKLHPKFYSREE